MVFALLAFFAVKPDSGPSKEVRLRKLISFWIRSSGINTRGKPVDATPCPAEPGAGA